MLTTEAAQAEIINENFTSPETVLPLPSFDQSLQRLPQQAFWRWTIQNLPCMCLTVDENIWLVVPSAAISVRTFLCTNCLACVQQPKAMTRLTRANS